MSDGKSETTDLPAALRYLAQYQGPPTRDRMIEAADEIERLRAEVERLEIREEDLWYEMKERS